MSVTFDKQTMSVEFSGETITFEQLNIKTNPEITQATEITITAAVKEIEENVFKDFYNLETINYEGSYIDWCKIKFKNRFSNPLFYTPNYGKCLVPTEGFDGYINTEKPDPVLYLTDVEYIPECTFYDLARNEQYANVFPFEDIVFGASLKEIGDYAFYGLNNVSNINSGLTLVDLQACESLQTIGTAAFSSCKYLQYVRLPKTSQPILIKDFAFYSSSVLANNFELVIETDLINFGHYVFNTIHSLSTPAKFLDNFNLTSVKNLTIIETDNTILTPELFKNLSSLVTLTIKLSTDSTINMLSDITDCLKECSNLKEIIVSDKKYKEVIITETYTNTSNNHTIQKTTTKQLSYSTITSKGKEAGALIRSQQITIIETDTTFSTTTTTKSTLNDILFIISELPPALATPTPNNASVLTDSSPTLDLTALAETDSNTDSITISISLDALSQLYQRSIAENAEIGATTCLKIVLPANTLFIAD